MKQLLNAGRDLKSASTLRGLGVLLTCMLCWVLGSSLVACSQKPLSFNAIDITGADYAKNLAWTDSKGEVHQLFGVFWIHPMSRCVPNVHGRHEGHQIELG